MPAPSRSQIIAAMTFSVILAAAGVAPIDAREGSAFPPAPIAADDGGPEIVRGEWTYANVLVLEHFVEPVPALMNVSRYAVRDNSDWVPVDEQILGRLTSATAKPPATYEVRVPIDIEGTSVDVDNDGATDAGVQIYGLFVGSNLTGDSYLEQMDQTAYRSYLTDPATGAIREGTFLVRAPDDAQGFPSGAGSDGLYFTEDDPVVGLPAGYTLVTLGRDGTVAFDRSRIATMNTLEEASEASPDFSDQGILESYRSLIDLLETRYSYTDLRGLDWERIRADYLPRVEAADAAGDLARYYLVLTELGRSVRDAHVFARSDDPVAKGAYIRSLDERFSGGLGARGAELDDGRYIVTQVLPGGPAADAGWVFGTEVLGVNGQPMAEWIDRMPLTDSVGTAEAARLAQVGIALKFPEGTEVEVEYRQPDEDTVRGVTLTAVGGLEYPESDVSDELISYRELDGGYGYVTWSRFADPQYVLAVWERFLRRFLGAPGILIDLRGNVGGNVELMYTMASYFFSETDPASYHWIDSYDFDDATGDLVKSFAVDRPLYAPKRDLRYDGAVVVLVDPHTASAGEYFPQFLQVHDRGLVVGERSSEGAGGYVERVAMPGNMTFFFTKGRTYFAGTDEVNVEAKGVTLDVRVPITEETERAKLDGRDPVLEAGIDALAEASVAIAGRRLAGTSWRLQSVVAGLQATEQIETPAGYTIAFADGGSMSITTDCNVATARYEVRAGGALAITPTVTTLAACPDTSLGDDFVSWLAASKTFQIGDDGLGILTDEASGVIALLFTPEPGPE